MSYLNHVSIRMYFCIKVTWLHSYYMSTSFDSWVVFVDMSSGLSCRFQDGYFKTGDIAVRKGIDQIILIDRYMSVCTYVC